jgi:hypothetical protein
MKTNTFILMKKYIGAIISKDVILDVNGKVKER